MSTNKQELLTIPETQIKAIVKEAVQQTFLNLGLDVSDPEGIIDFQRDMHYVRSARTRKESLETRAWGHVLTIVLSGIAAAVVMFFIGDHGAH